MVLIVRVAERLFSQMDLKNNREQNRLLKIFKIKSRSINSPDNFISDSSLFKICRKSKESLEELCIRNGDRLSKENLIKSIQILNKLQKLDLSYTRQVDDSAINELYLQRKPITSLTMRMLKNLTSVGLRQILLNCPNLEGLDISGCVKMDLLELIHIRRMLSLKTLILEYLELSFKHCQFIADSRVETLSLFCNIKSHNNYQTVRV